EGRAEDVVGGGLEALDVLVVHGAIADYGDYFGVVEGVLYHCFELGEARGVVVSDELVDKDDLVVDGC
ncbi:hypothetical protein V491_08402, partial [Pseudogymnoascus sp. VKM F-3775]